MNRTTVAFLGTLALSGGGEGCTTPDAVKHTARLEASAPARTPRSSSAYGVCYDVISEEARAVNEKIRETATATIAKRTHEKTEEKEEDGIPKATLDNIGRAVDAISRENNERASKDDAEVKKSKAIIAAYDYVKESLKDKGTISVGGVSTPDDDYQTFIDLFNIFKGLNDHRENKLKLEDMGFIVSFKVNEAYVYVLLDKNKKALYIF